MVLTAGGYSGKGRWHSLWMSHLECSIDFIGGYMVESLAFVSLWQALPVELGSLEEGESSHDIGASEGEGILDGTVYMALSGEMDDAVNVLILHQLVECFEVTDVHLDKLVVGLIFYILEVGKVAGIGQLIQVYDVVLRILVYEKADYMATDEACSTCDDDISL